MAWEYAELFDAEMEPADIEGQVSFWQDEASSLHVGQMGYRRRITKAGPRLEAEIYPAFGKEERGRLREAKRNQTPMKQQRLNEQRAKHQLILLIETNFSKDDYHLTLTYGGATPDLARCKKDVKNFFDRVKRKREKRGLDELKYIYAIGHDSGARLHVHVIINGGIEPKELQEIWGKGRTRADALQPNEYGLQGLANYLFRQNAGKKLAGQLPGKKTWIPSQCQGAQDRRGHPERGQGNHGTTVSGLYLCRVQGHAQRHCGRCLYPVPDEKMGGMTAWWTSEGCGS